MCGSIAIPFRAAPAASDICVSNDGPIRHYLPSRGRQAWTARARVTGISPLRGSLRAAPTACGCGGTGVSLSDGGRGSGWVNRPQCETARHRLLCGRMGTALHLPWPSLMRAHGPHRWSWRILQRRFSPPPGGPLVSGRIPLPDILFARIRTEVGKSPILPIQGKLGQNTIHDLEFLTV